MLEGLVEAVRRGESRVLVVRGEPGVGKSALLEFLADRAVGCRVARAAGVESEMELAFAGLHQLLGPMLDRLERLSVPQRDALGVAFAIHVGDAPDRYLVGLAVLSLLSEVAEERPLLCLVDDAQWLDRASVQALEFVARRLLAERVGLVLAVRQSGEEKLLAGFPELVVEGLRNGDARALLSSAIGWRLDERVRDRLIAETRGNPLALLELPRGLTQAELAGGFGLSSAPPLASRIEDSFKRRLEELPTGTQRLLLVAAADPIGDPTLVWRAAKRLGIAVEAADAAESQGLVEFGSQVVFRHPLVRSAIYRAASPKERRDVHRALAAATDRDLDPDRHAWHLAQATAGPDEEVASELESSAGRAQARGGLAAAAAFLERAAVLTPEPVRRGRRALAAAQAKFQAGAFDAALRLVAIAESGPLNELQRAQVELLRGQIAFALSPGSDALPQLLKAAKRLEPLDQRLARETYLEALTAVFFPGLLVSDESVLEAARAARAAPPSSQPPLASDLLLDGLALLITEGYAAGTPILRRAINAFRGEDMSRGERHRWLWLAARVAAFLWDDEAWDALSARFVQLARDTGELSVLPLALTTRSGVKMLAGDFAMASSLVDELEAVNEATGASLAPYAALTLAALRGREAEAAQLIETATREDVYRGEGQGLAFIQWVTAVLYNGLGRYDEALAAAQQAADDSREVRLALVELELIEAAARSGEAELARDALGRLSETTRASGTDWALGIEARSRALLSAGEAAEGLYREAIERLARTRVRVELARAHLLFGEWLRRGRRRTAARDQLRIAHEMFVSMGTEAFAERALRELAATGETARKRVVETSSELTAQEAQVARLARDGLSNAEIGARLFISSRTVQYHLHKVFTKLGISSRTQLERVFPSEAAKPARDDLAAARSRRDSA